MEKIIRITVPVTWEHLREARSRMDKPEGDARKDCLIAVALEHAGVRFLHVGATELHFSVRDSIPVPAEVRRFTMASFWGIGTCVQPFSPMSFPLPVPEQYLTKEAIDDASKNHS